MRLEDTILSSYLVHACRAERHVGCGHKGRAGASKEDAQRHARPMRAGAKRAAPVQPQGLSQCWMRRQRHDNGNPQLVAQMARAFKVPDAKAATASNVAQAGTFERFIYLTQARHVLARTKLAACALAL